MEQKLYLRDTEIDYVFILSSPLFTGCKIIIFLAYNRFLDMNKIYFNDIYIHFATMTLLLGYCLISAVYVLLNDDYSTVLRIFVIFVIGAVIYMLFKKDTFLPFLGISFVPNNLILEDKSPQGANIDYVLDMKGYENGTRVIYWAANKTDKIIEDPFEAYKDYHNVGVTKVVNGKAVVKIYCPDKYKVNHFGVHTSLMDKHFHYRIVFKDTGMMSPVMTAKVNC